ncbi:CapA family protein [Candidatus Woesearchaeota archaeon]|nr:CapA family protein [Candidatus Woesearchaeota archaeon]
MTDILLTGDIMLSRGVAKRIKEHGSLFPFENISHILKQGDIVFGNLECPISDRGTRRNKRYVFRANPESIKGLISAGFNVLSVANNHILDYGSEAFEDTVTFLKQNNILPAGQNLAVLRGIGFLAYSFNFSEETILKDIRDAKRKVNFLVVSMHWGKEYSFEPTDDQKRLARLMIDNGADIIAGHHPHVLQLIEKYKNGLIIYSLGNLVFDQYSHQGVKDSMIVKVNEEMKIEKIPVHINDDYQPCLK